MQYVAVMDLFKTDNKDTNSVTLPNSDGTNEENYIFREFRFGC